MARAEVRNAMNRLCRELALVDLDALRAGDDGGEEEGDDDNEEDTAILVAERIPVETWNRFAELDVLPRGLQLRQLVWDDGRVWVVEYPISRAHEAADRYCQRVFDVALPFQLAGTGQANLTGPGPNGQQVTYQPDLSFVPNRSVPGLQVPHGVVYNKWVTVVIEVMRSQPWRSVPRRWRYSNKQAALRKYPPFSTEQDGVMAFLATEDRFGPDLDRYRQGEPNPCTYTPEDDEEVLLGDKNPSGTFGYHRTEQHDRPSQFLDAAASSPAMAATLKAMEENSLQHLRETSAPNACTYSPIMEGQFPRAYTMKEILAERKRTALQRNLVKNEDSMPAEELHLALGPGAYEVNQDTNHEKIATPFTFTHEKRHGILENTATLGRIGCSPGPGLYRVESSTSVSSASTVASTPFRSKHAAAFLMRVRSDSQLQKKDAAVYSKELAKSYQELGASVERLGKRLASPELREQTFQRFDKDTTAFEAYRRGPGSYDLTCISPSRQKSNDGAVTSTQSVCFQLSPLPTIGRKPNSSFGRVASRDLLTSMITAGHASAHTIGPGVYDAYSSSFVVPTHNLGYKQEMQRTDPKAKLRSRRTASSAESEADGGTRKLSQKEMWKVMRHGPTLPS
ncbi:hypothetical protein PHYPSEUDO_001993 [Phytophthora pseudosyringae]|uniref:Uncharacterized protein n=1 Tax=Phytophthora pseudosyringae TaxID=221518 RepID=A0A8T1VUY4_9STRA|nr:hypothetical protein PHYPSEUDO_001993 [Phytophthora pseudosyringae]